MELDFLRETFELVLEEFQGIEECVGNLDDYVMTTGALENTKEASLLIGNWYDRLERQDLEDMADELEAAGFGEEDDPEE